MLLNIKTINTRNNENLNQQYVIFPFGNQIPKCFFTKPIYYIKRIVCQIIVRNIVPWCCVARLCLKGSSKNKYIQGPLKRTSWSRSQHIFCLNRTTKAQQKLRAMTITPSLCCIVSAENALPGAWRSAPLHFPHTEKYLAQRRCSFPRSAPPRQHKATDFIENQIWNKTRA